VDIFQVTGRTWRGTAFGGVKGRTELPGLVEGDSIFSAFNHALNNVIYYPDYLQGKLKIDEYVTHHRKFAEINDGFHDMHVRTTLPYKPDGSVT
jgi:S-(hydroxymethyl)glutathione dehydrogenase/alcohol dehydrogenase